MIAFLIGGEGRFMDAMINKLNKDGHRVYLLTGTKNSHTSYQKVFEKYNFEYDSDSIREILVSANPDIVIFMGAHDTRYDWENPRKTSVQFTADLTNVISAYSSVKKGRFLYISSQEVFGRSYIEDIKEDEPVSAANFRALALAQGEEICKSYYNTRGMQSIIVRMDNLYGTPKKGKKENNPCFKMTLEMLKNNKVSANSRNLFSMIHQNDAVQFLYQLVIAPKLEHSIYHISSGSIISQMQLAHMVSSAGGNGVEVVDDTVGSGYRLVLSGERFEKEFGRKIFVSYEEGVKKTVEYMKKHSSSFLNPEDSGAGWGNRLWRSIRQIFWMLVPYMENMVCFIPFFMLNNRAVSSQYFSKLDFYLLYVLLFAIIYGQQQATFSAILAVAGYMFRQMYTRSGLEILLDYNTYVWVAQLFILGLVVGYMRDQIRTMQSQELEEHLSRQIADIKDINESNVRVKGVMEQQLIDHKDSIGKIYSITSKLDQYMPDEVIFYAVEMLTKLMQTKDAAIYNVVNKDYARIFSASSKKARSLGNSIRYKDMTEVYEALSEKRVYINKRMNDQYPQMACAIFEDDEIQMIIMLWGLSWEKMTLGQANFLTVVSYMIQNAVLRAQRYIQALEAQRYKEGSRILSPEAFEPLVQAYMNAETRNLAECVLLKICISPDRQMEIDEIMTSHLRDSDYLGMMTDGNLYVLLANTTRANAVFVQERFDRNGYNTEVVENIAVCHKE